MDVAVLYKSGKRRLGPGEPRRSILGDGLLERARATSLALLGVTTAVGLAIVALALNQGWPLVAGSSVPRIPPRHQAVGEATVAAGVVEANSALRATGAGSRSQSVPTGHGQGHSGGAASPTAGSTPTGSSRLVVLPSTPAKPQADHPAGPPKQQSPPADVPSPQQTVVSPDPAPAAAAAPQSQPTPPTETAATTPPATTSEVPVESDVPSWSHGHGHAYGHSDESEDGQVSESGDQDEDAGGDGSDGHGWDHGYGSAGHHWGH